MKKHRLDFRKKKFQIASYEVAWRGGEGTQCLRYYFKEETNSEGNFTGRLEYNPVFLKTTQGGNQKLADSKWLTINKTEADIFPVLLYLKVGRKIKSDRLFLPKS